MVYEEREREREREREKDEKSVFRGDVLALSKKKKKDMELFNVEERYKCVL